MTHSYPCNNKQIRLGLIGGLGAIAGTDILQRIIRAAPDQSDGQHLDISFVQHPFGETVKPSDQDYNAISRKLYVYEMVLAMQDDDRDIALVPCFVSQTFLDEIVPEVDIQVIGIGEAIKDYLRGRGALKLGILTSSYVRETGFLDDIFFSPEHNVIYPTPDHQHALMNAVYGFDGLKSGKPSRSAREIVLKACANLLEGGAELILPGFTDIPALMGDVFERADLPILNCNQVFANYVVNASRAQIAQPFKVGVVGGVGPAATVDFVSRIVKNTPAQCDQDHIKVVVEQNPQIPDRTANLAGDGKDPTVALYAACKKLERSGANIIAIPCNTAHAFVDRIQRHTQILIINMLTETIAHIQARYPNVGRIGLLATNGTVQSKLYHDAACAAGLELITPDASHQAILMEVIYGKDGVKAGHTGKACRDRLLCVYDHLSQRNADALILGCTELPLVAPTPSHDEVPLVDPTEILAQKCVSLAMSSSATAIPSNHRSPANV